MQIETSNYGLEPSTDVTCATCTYNTIKISGRLFWKEEVWHNVTTYYELTHLPNQMILILMHILDKTAEYTEKELK